MQGKDDLKERDCMSLDRFSRYVGMNIQEKLGDNFQVLVEDITKINNTRKRALTIMKQGSKVNPVIYMESSYEEYKNGASLQDIEDSILQAYQENRSEEIFDAATFKEWEKAKGRIAYKLINYDRNREFLKNVPHRKILDLAIVYEYLLEVNKDGCMSILIHNGHMGMWCIAEEELHTVAFRNTPDLMGYKITSMKNVMLGIMFRRKAEDDGLGDLPNREELEKESVPMYVATNNYMLHGFGTVLYTNLLKEIADKWHSDIYILPSSIHEAILVPVDRAGRVEGLSNIVSVINRTQVKPEEFLSDNVYQYVRETGQILMQEETGYE